MSDDSFWSKSIKFPFRENNPFSQKLSWSYSDVRQLLTEIYQRMDPTSLTFELNQENLSSIVQSLRNRTMGGFSDHIPEVLQTLSQERYRRKGEECTILDYNPPLPIHSKCHNFLVNRIGDPIYRKCATCGSEIPLNVTWDKKIIDDWAPNHKIEATCPKCSRTIPFNGLFCRICNPADDRSWEKGWINPRNDLEWATPSITFHNDFFTKILKGFSFEQEIYQNYKNKFPKIRLSTSISTDNKFYNVEVDILFIEELRGPISKHSKLWAIEAKNWAKDVDLDTVEHFYETVSPITENLIFHSNSRYTNEAYSYCSEHNIKATFGTIIPPYVDLNYD